MKIQKILALSIIISISSILPISFVGASVWTSQNDYSPGSTVTISGNNSNNVGYISGENVTIGVSTPYGSESGSAVVGSDSSFNWSFNLPNDDSAVGNYSYTVTGQTSGVSESGSFTDAKPNTVSVGSQSPNPVHAGSSASYTVTVNFNGNGSSCTADLSVSGLPSGASLGSFSPSSVSGVGGSSPTSTLAINTLGSTVPGSYSFTVTATPTAGCQSGSAAKSGNGTLVVASADVTPPVIVPTVTPTPNGNGWNNTDVTVSWSVTDSESAITSTTGCGDTNLTSETAGTTVTCSATSGGGTSSNSVTVKIDKTKPVITGTATPSANGNGWNNTDVTVGFTCADTGAVQSGLDINTVAGSTLTAEGAGQSVTNTGTCTDMAGNTADSSTVSGINIDKTAPTVTLTTPAEGAVYLVGSTVLANFSDSDSLSGINTVSSTTANGTAINTTLGTHTFTVTATDMTGNSTTVTHTYQAQAYVFGGFQAPLTLSSKDFKKTSTIPVKITLTLGGLPYCSDSTTTRLYVGEGSSYLLATYAKAIASGSSNTDNWMRCDTTAMQYIFNLSTKQLTKGTHFLKVHLDDGTDHYITIVVN